MPASRGAVFARPKSRILAPCGDEEDVGRLDVAMEDMSWCARVQGIRETDAVIDQLVTVQRAAREPLGAAFHLEQLHRDERRLAGLAVPTS